MRGFSGKIASAFWQIYCVLSSVVNLDGVASAVGIGELARVVPLERREWRAWAAACYNDQIVYCVASTSYVMRKACRAAGVSTHSDAVYGMRALLRCGEIHEWLALLMPTLLVDCCRYSACTNGAWRLVSVLPRTVSFAGRAVPLSSKRAQAAVCLYHTRRHEFATSRGRWSDRWPL